MQYAIYFVLDEGALFHFENYAARFQALKVVPCVAGDINAYAALFPVEDDAFYDFAVVVIGIYAYTTLQQDEGFVLGHMVVYGYLCTHLQCVQKAVALVVEALVKIVVHAQARRRLGLLYHAIY